MWFWKKKKDPEKVAIEAIEAVRDEARKAIQVPTEAIEAVRDTAAESIRRIGGRYHAAIGNLEGDLSRIVSRFEQHINELLIKQVKLKPLDDVKVIRESIATPEFPDLDSRAVFANPYAIPDPDFSDHFDMLEQSIEKDK